MRIIICGQKYFARLVAERLISISGVTVATIICPRSDEKIKTFAEIKRIPVSHKLSAETMPPDIDLIVCAHSHDFVPEQAIARARFGAIGYHPSYLPLYRGRSAIEWAIKLRERITGGTVYRLTNTVDGGPIIEREPVLISPDDDVRSLWRFKLQPLGADLLERAVKRFLSEDYIHGEEQDHACATWFPSMERAPIHRPDLLKLTYKRD